MSSPVPGYDPVYLAKLVSQINEHNVRLDLAPEFNKVRQLIVAAVLALLAITIIGAGVIGVFGTSASWSRLSPVLDTVLAIEARALGTAIAFYMAKQD